MSDALLEAVRRPEALPERYARCPFCERVYRWHPGFADHRDECTLRPLNRPHIRWTAVAMYGGDA